jgi:hypothetical protein
MQNFTYGIRKKKDTLMVVTYVLLIFQMALAESKLGIISTFFNYFDEMVTVLLLIYLICFYLKHKAIEKDDFILLSLYFLLLFIGFLSFIYYKLQPLLIGIEDAFICSKFIIGYLGIKTIYKNKIEKDFVKNNFKPVSKIIIIVLFLLTLHDIFFSPLFPKFDFRYFTYSIELCFPHPTYLAASVIVIMCVLMSSYQKGDFKYLMMASFVIFMTFRSKAISFIIIFWLLYFMIYRFQIRSKIIIVPVALFGGIFAGYRKFTEYFFGDHFSARAVMLKDALILARESFPLGKGFATFGSNLSVQSYSPLYYRFGYDGIEGMSQSTASYLNDGFWQIILAQFGFFGCILMLFIILQFFCYTIQMKKTESSYIALLALNIYMLISSTAESSYFNPFSLLYFMVISFIVNQTGDKRTKYADGRQV